MGVRSRVGVVGVGFIGVRHVRAWRELGAPVVVYATEPEHREDAARRYGVEAAESYEALLAGSDVVDVCTPTDTHAELVAAAAAAGRHVICEKPLAGTYESGAEMIRTCAAAGVQLHVAHVVRYFAEYAALRAAVVEGRVGRVETLWLTRSGATPRWAPWVIDEERSGGILYDFMIHDYDFARWVAGDVAEVRARLARGVETRGKVELHHASGAVSYVSGLWGAPEKVFRTTVEIDGDGGRLTHDSTAAGGLPDDPFVRQLGEFAAAIENGGPPPRVSAEDGLAAVGIALAAVESARTGRPVRPQ